MTAQMTDAKSILAFILAGNAIVTLKSKTTGSRYTFKLRQADKKNETDKPVYFVSFLTGPENSSDYSYIGLIRDGEFTVTARSRHMENSIPVKTFRWSYANFLANRVPEKLEVWHEGRCGRCGRLLTVPESIASGFGPECAGRMVA